MHNINRLLAAALAATAPVGAIAISAPASALSRCGVGAAGFSRDWGAADCAYVAERPIRWARWGYYAPAYRAYRHHYYR